MSGRLSDENGACESIAARIVKRPGESLHTPIKAHVDYCGGHGSLARFIALFFVNMLPEVSHDNQECDEVVGGMSCNRNQQIGGWIHHQQCREIQSGNCSQERIERSYQMSQAKGGIGDNDCETLIKLRYPAIQKPSKQKNDPPS